VLFEAQIAFLARNNQLVSLEEAVKLLEFGARLPTDVYAITLDDCYRGLIKYVLPICRKYACPFTVFVSTGPLATGMPHAFDYVLALAEGTSRQAVDLSSQGLKKFSLAGEEEKYDFAVSVSGLLRNWPVAKQKRFLDSLCEQLQAFPQKEDFRDLLLSREDFKALCHDDLVTIGGHTVNHLNLPALPVEECEKEVRENKVMLEELLGRQLHFFAYPFGGESSYDQKVIEVVKKEGFSHAFVLRRRRETGLNPYTISRQNIHSGSCVGPGADFSESLFAIEISGMGDWLFARCNGHRKKPCP